MACRQRKNDGGTPFTNWTRLQPGLESNTGVGFVGSDVDLIWYNYKQAFFMLLEEKQNMAGISPSQEAVEAILHQALGFALNHPDFRLCSLRKPIPPRITYCGYHLIQFENTGPEDGAIYIDGVEASKKELIDFLQFKWTPIIQCHLDQQDRIRASHTQLDLEHVAQYIKQTVRSIHPEIQLLRIAWKQKKQELDEMETMFSSQDDLTECEAGIMEAERILQFQDIEALTNEVPA